MKWHYAILGVSLSLGCDDPGSRSTERFDTLGPRTDTVEAGDTASTARDATDAADGTASGDTSGPDVVGDGSVCARWNADRAQRTEGAWTGSASSCTAGDVLSPGRDNALRQVNLYRWMAGLPAVELSEAKNEAAQACALLMQANRTIDHEVPTSWKCYEPVGAATAGLSNLATTPGVLAVDLYMTDNDVPTLGHRRWILSNSLGPIGVGSTSGYSCLHVINGTGRAGARWTAWPPPGEVPVEAIHMGQGLDVDTAGWSIQSDTVSFAGATVRVLRGGEERAVTVSQAAQGYGSAYALRIVPKGWKTAVGETYQVEVTLAREVISYSFSVVQCR